MPQTIVTSVETPETVPAQKRLRILSISSVFPNPKEPEHGVFVRSRLEALANHSDITVVAPVPAIDYARRSISGPIPLARISDTLTVLYPRWIYPPLGTAVNVFLLSAQLLPAIRRARQNSPVDLIDAHFGYPDGIAAALLASLFKLPFSITLRGNETMHAKHRTRGWLLSWMLRRANLVVTVSSRLKEFALSRGAAPNRVLNIPNGIDNTVFYRRDRTAIKAKLGIPGNRQIVLSAGSLIERKGHHRVASEIAGFVRAGHPVHLIIAGGPGREGAFETKLRAEIQSAGLQNNVTFTGHVDPATLAELMSAADVFCLASSREGWPNVVHEALACGTPVVATDVGAVPEMVPAQDFGFVVPLGDQQALGKALETALNHNWNRSKIAAYGQSRSWQQVAHEVLQAMHQVVKDREAK